ncbi:amino-acid N-acetyltransferase [Aneurinibacillus soli]|uniref:Amino-acid acetyltransferase n=1 Tax=Aneurinibacillus soli TaxID=1500254 RepID=A0A0U4WLC7_9BACL|nr:N-acetyltransferase [Aneurinibacillus soli]PYE59445.1 amino-acid N-acetyltransferase [Aneurinibacillus soli]BAU29225.1 Amino-acid acetyltransferase [Aneurinibacillus soli]
MQIRKAKIHDLDGMMALINEYAQEGLMLPRSKLSLCETLHCFSVVVDDKGEVSEAGTIVGVGGLHILWEDLAEVRSLAISGKAKGKGLGKLLVNHLVQEAQELGLQRVMSLTYQQVFFEKCEFYVVQKETLPHKVWKDCVNCSKFPSCDEIAMIRDLAPITAAV